MYYKKITIIVLILVMFSSLAIAEEWITINGNTTPQKPVVTVISSDNSETIINVEIKGFYKEDVNVQGETYQKLEFPGYFTTQTIGKPALPIITELIGIPNDKNVRISVVDSTITVLSGYKVYPFQTPLMEGEETVSFDIDEEFYVSNLYFPEISGTVSSPMIWRNVRNVNMLLTPIKNNPTSGDLEILSNFIVRIEYYGTSSENILSPEPRYIRPEYEKMYQSLILNYDYLSLNRKGTKDDDDYEYLIISADNFSPELDEFVNWKMRKGLKTNLVTISETGSSSNDIKDYIIYEYDNFNIEYVLFVGDHADIPMHYDEEPYSWWAWGDFWYSCITGDDLEPEIAVGRFSVDSFEDLDNIMSKSISYENYPPMDNWVEKSLLIAHKENAPYKYQACKERIRLATNTDSGTYLVMYPIFDKAYGAHTAQGGNDATNQTIIDAINEGRGVVNYRGHGGDEGWAASWSYQYNAFDYEETISLTNGKYTPTIFSIACNTGDINHSNDCHAEVFTNMEQGAVAYFGATRTTPTTENHTLDEQLYNFAFDLGFLNIGYTANKAKIRTMVNHGYNGMSKLNSHAYLWCGDPSLEIWTDVPQKLYADVNYDENLVRVIDDDDDPIENAPVVFDDGVNYEVVYSDEDGYAISTFAINHFTEISVTKHDYLPTYTHILEEDEVWEERHIVRGNIIVPSGKTLTIAGDVSLPKYSQLIGEAGGSIIVQEAIYCMGATLTIPESSRLCLNGAGLVVGSSGGNHGAILLSGGEMLLDNNSNFTLHDTLTLSGGSLVEVKNGSDIYFQHFSRIYGTDHTVWEDPATGERYDTWEEASQNIPNIGAENEISGDRIVANSNGEITAWYAIIGAKEDNFWDGFLLSKEYLGPVGTFNYCDISNISKIEASGGELDIKYCNLFNFGQIFVHDEACLTIWSSTIENSNVTPIVCLESRLISLGNIIRNNPNGTGIANYYPNPIGINVVYHNLIENNSQSGMYNYSFPLQMWCSRIKNNGNYGLVCLGYSETISDSVLFSNNVGAEIIASCSAFPEFYNNWGMNTVFDEYDPDGYNYTDQYLLMCGQHIPPCHDVSAVEFPNSNDPDFEDRFYPNIDAFYFGDEKPPEKLLYESAIADISVEEYESAKTTMAEIVDDYPETETAISALQWLMYLEKFSGHDYVSLRDYIENIDDVSYPHLERTKYNTITSTYMAEKDYEAAITRLEAILADPPSEPDSIFAYIDEGYCYLKLDEEGGKSAPVECKFKPRSFDEFKYVSQNLTQNLLDKAIPTSEPPTSDPQTIEFALHQNYPNPASLSTTFSFSIPANTKNAELKIYNIKGQLVKTFIQESNEKGITDNFKWDCKDKNDRILSNGIYFYKLTADKQEIVKKMLLMR